MLMLVKHFRMSRGNIPPHIYISKRTTAGPNDTIMISKMTVMTLQITTETAKTQIHPGTLCLSCLSCLHQEHHFASLRICQHSSLHTFFLFSTLQLGSRSQSQLVWDETPDTSVAGPTQQSSHTFRSVGVVHFLVLACFTLWEEAGVLSWFGPAVYLQREGSLWRHWPCLAAH